MLSSKKPSFQPTVQGGTPVRSTVITPRAFGQTIAVPVTVAVGLQSLAVAASTAGARRRRVATVPSSRRRAFIQTSVGGPRGIIRRAREEGRRVTDFHTPVEIPSRSF